MAHICIFLSPHICISFMVFTIILFPLDSGPMHLHVANTYHNGVRLKWNVAPSCYSRSKIVVRYFSSDGKRFSRFIDKNADWFDLTGLDSEKSYNLSFVTEYSDQQSDPVYLSFTTLEAPGLTGGAIAGISIGGEFNVFLTVVIEMFSLNK